MKVVLGAVLNFDSYEDLIVACQEVIDENVMKEFLKYNGTLLYNHVDGDYDCIFNDSIKEVQVSILG